MCGFAAWVVDIVLSSDPSCLCVTLGGHTVSLEAEGLFSALMCLWDLDIEYLQISPCTSLPNPKPSISGGAGLVMGVGW